MAGPSPQSAPPAAGRTPPAEHRVEQHAPDPATSAGAAGAAALRARLGPPLLAALLVGLSLGTFATELTTALAGLAALALGDRRRLADGLWPLLPLALAFALAAPGGGLLAWREVLGRVWPLVPLAVIPALATARDRRAEDLALHAAAVVALAALGWRLATGADTARGPWSHHLTLGYALLAPLAVALARRRLGHAAALLAGVAAAGGSGPLLSAVVLGLALLVPPAAALGAGLAAALALVRLLSGQDELHQRALLWASGAWLAVDRPLGAGPAAIREELAAVQHQLQPGFHFPLHAHDSALQLGALVGLGGWIALVVLGAEAWRRTDRPGRALLAALAVGALTQDVLGDLEVARAAAAWIAWGALRPPPSAEPAPAAAVPVPRRSP